MKKNLLSTLPIVAQCLGNKYGITVGIGGNDAYTDGKHIQLPALPEDDEKLAVLARGFIDHEAAHVRFTDASKEGTALEKELQNILEDVRIEHRMGKQFPGSKTNLDKLSREMVETGEFHVPDENAHPASVVCSYLLHTLRLECLEQKALAPLAPETAKRFKAAFSEGVAIRVAALGREVLKCGSTEEVKELVKRIVQSLEDEQDPPQDPPKQESDDSSQSTSQQEGGGEGQTDSQGQNPGDSASQTTEGNGQDDSGKPAQSAAEQAKSATDEQVGNHDVGSKAKEQLANEAKQVNPAEKVTTAVDVAGTGRAALTFGGTVPNTAQVKRATVALRSRIEGLIQASKLERTRTTRTGRRIDTRYIHRIAMNDPRVFRQTREKTAVNTAVSILLDRSGSMKKDKIELATASVYSVAMSLSQIRDVALHTAVFPVDDIDVATLTDFDQPLKPEDYAVSASGGTPLDLALWSVAAKLAMRSEPRKIVLVVTDGKPARLPQTQQMARRMEESGIEMLGLGIQTMAHDLFSESKVITDLNDLAPAMFGMLEKRLAQAA